MTLTVPVPCPLAIWVFTLRKEEAGALAVLRVGLAYVPHTAGLRDQTQCSLIFPFPKLHSGPALSERREDPHDENMPHGTETLERRVCYPNLVFICNPFNSLP